MEELQVSRSVLLVSMVGEQVDECNLKKKKPIGEGERVEQEKNPQDDAGLLSFAFFWCVELRHIC